MKYLQDSDGNVLPLPEQVQIFKRLVLFTSFSIAGDFSSDFQVANDSETRATLGYYGINQTQKLIQKPFYFYIDGNKLFEGRVFIRSVGEQFDLFFVAGNGNWMNQIKGKVTDIDFSDFDLTFDGPTVIANMNTTEGIIFPVMDWAYNFKKLSNQFLVRPIIGVSVDSYYDFYPCFHAHTILERIFDTYGLAIGGNLVSHTAYNDLVITPEVIQAQAYTSPLTSAEFMETVQEDIFTTGAVNFVTGSENFDAAGKSIVVPRDTNGGSATITTDLRTNQMFGTRNITFRVLINSGATPDRIVTVTHTTTLQTYGFTVALPAMNVGDVITMSVTPDHTGSPSTTIKVRADFNIIYPENYVRVKNMLPQIDQFDFIKYIAQRFNCLIEYDESEQRVNFTTMDSLEELDAQDLSDNVVSYQQIPASGYAETEYIRTTPAAELINYQEDNLNFGDAAISSDGDGSHDMIVTPLGPAESFENENLDWLLTNVPLVKLEDADTGTPFTSVTDAGGDAIFNGSIDLNIQNDEVFRIESTLYNGYGVNQSYGLADVAPYPITYLGDDSGLIFKQKIVFQNVGARELLVCRNIDINDINTGSQTYGYIQMRIRDRNDVYPIDNISWAFFAKPNISTGLDNFRIGLNYGPVDGTGNIPFGSVFHNRLKQIVKGSHMMTSLLLSQAQFSNLNLKRLVYLRVMDVEGYFFISEFKDGYTNQFTPVQLDLIYMGNG